VPDHLTSDQNVFQIAEDLKGGGSWLGTARDYVQRHCICGETVIWGSETPMRLTMREIEEMALMIAVSAIEADRSKRRG
jgi:hypothetical protein